MTETPINTDILKSIYQGFLSITFLTFLKNFSAGDFQAISAGIMAWAVGLATIYKILHDIKRERAKDAKKTPPNQEPD